MPGVRSAIIAISGPLFGARAAKCRICHFACTARSLRAPRLFGAYSCSRSARRIASTRSRVSSECTRLISCCGAVETCWRRRCSSRATETRNAEARRGPACGACVRCGCRAQRPQWTSGGSSSSPIMSSTRRRRSNPAASPPERRHMYVASWRLQHPLQQAGSASSAVARALYHHRQSVHQEQRLHDH